MIAIHLVNTAGVPPAQLRRVESALVTQANTDLRSAWHTPKIKFAATGKWTLTLVAGRAWPSSDAADAGWHENNGNPASFVNSSTREWSVVASHEMLEMMLNPTDARAINSLSPEIADPVSWCTYRIGKVRVSDFVRPSWFYLRSKGPWDKLHVLTRPLETSPCG